MSSCATVFVEAKGRLYAIGVEWGSRGQSASLAQAAAERAALRSAPYIVLRDEPEQFGLASPAADAKPTLLHPWYAGAIAVTESHRKNTLAAWELGNGQFWILAIGSEGGVITDQVVSGEDQAKLVYGAYLGESEYRTKFAPPSWGVGGARDDSYLGLLEAAKGARFGTPGSNAASRPLRLAAGVVVGLLIAGPALYLFTRHPTRQAVTSTKPPPPPLQIIPAVNTAVICLYRMQQDSGLEKGIPLYGVANAKCAAGKVEYTLRPIDAGPSPKPLAYIRNTYLPNGTLSGDGTIMVTEQVDTAPLTGPLHPTQSLDAVVSTLRATGDAFLASVELHPALAGPVGGDWQSVSWVFKTTAPAPYWAPALTGEFTTITSINRAYSKGIYSWTIEGTTYAAR